MATYPLIYLTDSGGQVWLLGVNNAGLLQTTPVTGHTGPNSTPLADMVILQTWDLSVLTSGMLQLNPSVLTSAPQQIPLVAPNNTVFAIQASSGLLQTTLYTAAACPFSLGDATGALSARLFDSLRQFWTAAECTIYVKEALRTWNALTGYWRGDFTFMAQPEITWYDLTDTTAMPNTLRPETLSSVDLLTTIEYHLLEPPVGDGAWTGSTQYTLEDLKAAIQKRRNEILGTTGCQVSQAVIQAQAIRTPLPVNVIDVRRVLFRPSDETIAPTVVWEDDTWSLDSYQTDYTVTPNDVPSSYRLTTQPWLTFDTDVPPIPGRYEIIVVLVGSENETPQSPVTALYMPDDWAWVLKWGALSDLFAREGNAKDVLRSQYCEQRYRDGLKLLSQAPALLALRVSNVPLPIDSVTNADQYENDWPARAEGTPETAYVAGLNLLALSPAPENPSNYSLTATVVQNAPMPADDNSCLLLDRSLFDVIVDYAQHLAALKMGGKEFMDTMPHYQRFMAAATIYSAKYLQSGEYSRTLQEISQREEMTNPRMAIEEDNG